MATKIRLARAGAKKRPFYQIVVADERCRRDGRFIENMGTYDPTKNPAAVKLNEEKALAWLGKGCTTYRHCPPAPQKCRNSRQGSRSGSIADRIHSIPVRRSFYVN